MSIGARCCSTRVYVMLAGLVGMLAYLLNAFAANAAVLIVSQGLFFGEQIFALIQTTN